jgi:hypothetical protein
MPLFGPSAFLSSLSYFGFYESPSLLPILYLCHATISIAYCWWGSHRVAKCAVRDPEFVSTGDPVFGHAPPYLYATVIVMSLMGDHDIEQGQEGESEVFSPYGVLIAVGLRRFRRDRTASGRLRQQHDALGRPELGAHLVPMGDIQWLTGWC